MKNTSNKKTSYIFVLDHEDRKCYKYIYESSYPLQIVDEIATFLSEAGHRPDHFDYMITDHDVVEGV